MTLSFIAFVHVYFSVSSTTNSKNIFKGALHPQGQMTVGGIS